MNDSCWKGYGVREKNVYKYAQGKEEQGKFELFVTEGGYGADATKMADSVNLFSDLVLIGKLKQVWPIRI